MRIGVLMLLVGLLVLGQASMVYAETEKQNIAFSMPAAWTPGQKGSRGELPFTIGQTGIFGYIRSFEAQGSQLQWARDEAKQLPSKGFSIVTEPSEQQFGQSAWAGLVWNRTMPVKGTPVLMRGEQYYLKGGTSMVEVLLGGPEAVFEQFNRSELDRFLASVAFGTRAARDTARSTGNAEQLANKSRLAQRQDVLGEWQLVHQVVSPTVPHDSLFFSQYQIWSFSADGVVKNIASTTPFEKELLPTLLTHMPQDSRFTFQQDGVLVIERIGNDRDLIVISILNEDMHTPLEPNMPVLKQGDLLLSYMKSKDEPYMRRVLQRVTIPRLDLEGNN